MYVETGTEPGYKVSIGRSHLVYVCGPFLSHYVSCLGMQFMFIIKSFTRIIFERDCLIAREEAKENESKKPGLHEKEKAESEDTASIL